METRRSPHLGERAVIKTHKRLNQREQNACFNETIRNMPRSFQMKLLSLADQAFFSVDWRTEMANNTGFVNGCASRPCAETEVCVPVGRSRDQHRCLSLPADCGPPSVDNGSLTWQSTQQGQVATLTCDRYFQLTPSGSSQLTCAVTSRWTPLNVTCQAVSGR